MPRRWLLLTPMMPLVPALACSTVTHLFSGGGSTPAGQAEGTPVLPAEGQGPDSGYPPVPGGDTPTPEQRELPEES